MEDEIEQRRRAHLKRLEANHAADFEDRFVIEKTRAEKRAAEISDAISADWNAKQKARREGLAAASPATAPDGKPPLPEGWRDEHWKTLQSMAADYAGVETTDKASSIAALEAYEATLRRETAS
jgi:hypothetical protein